MPHSGVRLRPAEPGDAAGIGHVFDAAVRAGWRYLGDLVRQPLFPASEWDQLIADHGLAVYTAAGYRPDGTVRESNFRGIALREPRLVKQLTLQAQ
jgi:hypothetical protein